MRILVLGGNGMLGHQIVGSLSSRHRVGATFRRPRNLSEPVASRLTTEPFFNVDALQLQTVRRAVTEFRPDAIVNAIGLIKHRLDPLDEQGGMAINGLFPQLLKDVSARAGVRLVHVSTDCVFSGRKGNYKESDVPDATDPYGRSKLAGELTGDGCITLRTSMIGLELDRKLGLIEWFLRQRGPVKGFRRAVFSGVTTLELARVVEHVLVHHADKDGLYHVSSTAIDKYTLLTMLQERLNHAIAIEPDDEFICDRSLDSSRFRDDFDYRAPTWAKMLDELAEQIEARTG